MSYTNQKFRENSSNKFRKKFKGLSMAAMTGLPISTIVWKPKPGEIYMLTEAYYVKVNVLDANGLQAIPDGTPQFKLSIGSTDITNPVQPNQLQKTYRVVFIGGAPTNEYIAYDKPLIVSHILAQTVGAGTQAVKWDFDLVLVATKISD